MRHGLERFNIDRRLTGQHETLNALCLRYIVNNILSQNPNKCTYYFTNFVIFRLFITHEHEQILHACRQKWLEK